MTVKEYLKLDSDIRKKTSCASPSCFISFFRDKKKFESAVSAADKALAANPSDCDALLLKGKLLASSGSFKQAEEIFKAGLLESKDKNLFLFMTADIQFNTGDIKTALETINGASADYPHAHLMRGRIHFASDDIAESEKEV